MSKSNRFLINELKSYLKKDYVFCPDTNFFMEFPDVIESLKGEKVLISKTSFEEMDRLKSVSDDATDEEKHSAYKRRRGLAAMDNVEAIIVPDVTQAYLKSKGLSVSNDERIIGSYLKQHEDTGEKVLFLTLDRGARTIARSVGLEYLKADIDTAFNNGKAQQKRGKLINPFVLIGRLIRGLFLGGKALFNAIFLFAIIGLVIMTVIENIEDDRYAKNMNVIEGDQSSLSAEVVKASNDEDKNKFEFTIDLLNNTNQSILLTGYYSEELKEQIEEYTNLQERKEKGERLNVIEKSSLSNFDSLLKGFGIKIIYNDGTEEVMERHSSIAPREKKSIRLSSNGQLEDIDKVHIQYQIGEETELQTITINPNL